MNRLLKLALGGLLALPGSQLVDLQPVQAAESDQVEVPSTPQQFRFGGRFGPGFGHGFRPGFGYGFGPGFGYGFRPRFGYGFQPFGCGYGFQPFGCGYGGFAPFYGYGGGCASPCF